MASEGWEAAPPGPVLLALDEVHLWRIPLVLPPDRMAALEALLSHGERERAARFRFPAHRAAFVAGRGAQREVLARYAGVPPESIVYRESAHGKLALDGPAAESGVRFNASNSGELALVAVARGRELGVDLERVKPMPDAMDVARRFFSAPENEVLSALAEPLRETAFFRCWTRKEAYIKAVGEGLSMPLDRFDVAFADGETPRLLATRGDAAEASRWRLAAVDPGPGYLGAVAVEGDGWRLRAFRWEGG